MFIQPLCIDMASRVRPHRHLLTQKQNKIRLECSRLLLNWLKYHGSTENMFSDKKFFAADQAYNRRNDRWVRGEAEATPVMRTKHPQGIMALGVVASDGKKMPIHFFEVGLKVKVYIYADEEGEV